ncbi:MAG: hypothetical protein IPJ97_08605 [Proteobacteria bacterium]|nr:hypothetical protein [Pseudomonadota bacterium]
MRFEIDVGCNQQRHHHHRSTENDPGLATAKSMQLDQVDYRRPSPLEGPRQKSAATKVPINARDTSGWRMNATMAIEVKP